MGAEADISFEGGKHFIPSSNISVKKNIVGIQKTLEQIKADVYLLQELSTGSILNHWHNLRKAVQDTLPNHSSSRVSNFSLPLFFNVLKNEHGMGTFVKNTFEIIKKQTRPFMVSEYYYKIIPRLDFALTTIVRTDDGKQIAFVNTHLSSFDVGGIMRMTQFLDLMSYVKQLAKEGYAVIIGADWNMYSGKFNFIKREDEERYKTYTHNFPINLIENGWTAHFSENVHTLRAANRPYVKGKSTTGTVDGFICSPGITVETMETLDLDFEHSDHNPVAITVSY